MFLSTFKIMRNHKNNTFVEKEEILWKIWEFFPYFYYLSKII